MFLVGLASLVGMEATSVSIDASQAVCPLGERLHCGRVHLFSSLPRGKRQHKKGRMVSKVHHCLTETQDIANVVIIQQIRSMV